MILIYSGCCKNKPNPLAVISVSDTTGYAPLTVTFSAGQSSNYSAIEYFLWSFPDADIQNETVEKTFYSHGDYTVKLLISDECDRFSEDIITIKVKNPSDMNILTDNLLENYLDTLVHNHVTKFFVDPYVCGMSLAFIDGTEVFTYNYGETMNGNSILPDNNTMYQIASVTKTFTSITMNHWLHQNDISQDSSIVSFLPDSISLGLSNGVDVTFRHLLNHTSGLPRIPNNMPNINTNDPYIEYDSLKMYEYLMNNSLLRVPGTAPVNWDQFNVYYGNLAYGLVGTILERQTGISLQTIFEETLLTKLGLNHTTLDRIENFPNRAFPNRKDYNAAYWHFESMSGAGGLNSNLNDLITYARFLITEDESTKLGKAITKSLQPAYIIGTQTISHPWLKYSNSSNDIVFRHDGATYGFSTEFRVNKEKQRAMICLSNNYNSDHDKAILNTLFNRFIDPSNNKSSDTKKETVISLDVIEF